MCLVGACTAWFGQLFLYRIVRDELEGEDLVAARVGVFYVPSVIFWGGGFEKEAFLVGCFGMLLLASYRVLKSRALRYLPLMVLGGVGVAMVKAYALVPYSFGVAAFIYAVRATEGGGTIRIRPVYLVVGAVVAVLGLVILGRVLPEFAADKVAESATQNREAFRTMNGGSNVDLGGEGTPGFLVLPMAFINTFFRPAIFDVKNAPMLFAAVETTFLSFTVVSLAASPRESSSSILRSPFMFSSLCFVLAFGLGVGMATANLRALSRYRMPMMPLYATALLVLRQRERSKSSSADAAARARLVGLMRPTRSRRQT